MSKYEAHITCHVDNAERVKTIGTGLSWKFSCIDGDALMGPKPYCYLTGYAPDKQDLYMNMRVVMHELQVCGIEVLRSKIEHIIYDSKTKINEL